MHVFVGNANVPATRFCLTTADQAFDRKHILAVNLARSFALQRLNNGLVKLLTIGLAQPELFVEIANEICKTDRIVIKHSKEGTGAKPAATDQVKVHYEGRLIDGKVFDSSIARGEPATFPLNGVIACWTEGVQTMKVGGKAQLICPASLAYGANGSPPTIPPESTLVFDVELIEIVK